MTKRKDFKDMYKGHYKGGREKSFLILATEKEFKQMEKTVKESEFKSRSDLVHHIIGKYLSMLIKRKGKRKGKNGKVKS